MKKLSLALLLVVSLTLAACGEEAATTAPSTDNGAATSAPSTGGGSSTLTIDAAAGGTLAFAATAAETTAGEVTVTFNNPGALAHNLVIVKPGEEQAAVDASMASAPDFLPPADKALGHSKTIAAGASDTFTVSLQPGTYSFICTYPAHYTAGMKGTLTVK